MDSKFSPERVDVAKVAEFSLSLGMLLAMGLFLGGMAVRHAELSLAHSQTHIAQIHGAVVV